MAHGTPRKKTLAYKHKIIKWQAIRTKNIIQWAQNHKMFSYYKAYPVEWCSWLMCACANTVLCAVHWKSIFEDAMRYKLFSFLKIEREPDLTRQREFFLQYVFDVGYMTSKTKKFPAFFDPLKFFLKGKLVHSFNSWHEVFEPLRHCRSEPEPVKDENLADGWIEL